MPLTIKPQAQCRWDAVALGEVMLRLDPGDGRIRTAREFKVWEGGGEYNVVRGLRRCFGLRTAVVTAIVDNEVGRLLEDLMLQGGVDLSHVKWVPFDGVGRAARVGLNFTEKGFGMRGGGGLFRPRPLGGVAAEARRRGLGPALPAGGRALVPLRRDLRGAVGHHGRTDDRGHAGRARGRHDRLLRPELPRVAVEIARRHRSGPSRSTGGSRRWST